MTSTSLREILKFPARRSQSKPRTTGLTMAVDDGLPLHRLKDLLDLSGDYVDEAKFIGSSACLLTPEMLNAKIALYRDHGIDVFFGGQFTEVLYAQGGKAAVETGVQALQDLGVASAEISDTYDFIPLSVRLDLMDLALGIGLKLHGEVGAKEALGDGDKLVEEALACFEAACHMVTIEAGEFVDANTGGINRPVFDAIQRGLSDRIDRIMFEIPGRWIPGTTSSQIHRMSKELIGLAGPDVSIGSVAFDNVFIVEAVRNGLTGRPLGPKALD
ncbi:MAG: phosphosulfolactate synthase [Pseudomonadota bacterium]